MTSRWLWAIVALALVARLSLLAAAWGDHGGAFTPDSQDYWQLARALVADGRFERTSPPGEKQGPEIFRTPGYPLLVAPAVAGSTAGGEFAGWHAVAIAQIILDCLLVILTCHLGWELAGRRVGLAAAAFQAISPLAMASSCRMLSDSVFAFMLTAAALMMVKYLKLGSTAFPGCAAQAGKPVLPSRWLLVFSAVVLALACYVRPIGVSAVAVFAIVLFFVRLGAKWSLGASLARAAGFSLIVGALLAPWVVHNGIAGGYWGFSCVATDTLYKYSLPRIIAASEGVSLDRAQDELAAGRPNGRELRTVGEWANFRAGRCALVIAAHPLTAAGIQLKGDAAFWLPGATDVLEVAGLSSGSRGTLDVLHEQGPWAAARFYFSGRPEATAVAIPLVLIFLVKMAGVIACVVRRFSPHLPAEVWLVALLVIVSALTPGPAAHPRFRVPVEPILSIAAAMGWMRLTKGTRE